MKEFNLYSVLKRKFKPKSECPNQYKAYPNLTRGLSLTGIDQLWSSDITYIRIDAEFVYLAAILDVYSRKVIGWSIGKTIDHKLCLAALDAAIRSRKPSPGCIHHSDRGLQYMSDAYVDRLEAAGFQVSMSAQAAPTENAYIESFFKTLKHEEVLIRDYSTFEDVRKNVPKFIEELYNKKRLHSSIGYEPPEVFERQLKTMRESSRPVQKLAGTLQN
jgi:transposase InsO family protein